MCQFFFNIIVELLYQTRSLRKKKRITARAHVPPHLARSFRFFSRFTLSLEVYPGGENLKKKKSKAPAGGYFSAVTAYK